MSKHVRDEKVLEPYMYLGQILGKNVRGVLIDCFQEWILIPQEKMEIIKVTGLVTYYLFH
jgi:geranylgeranyl diphosphate synthase, type III